jgi:hypothetical protein
MEIPDPDPGGAWIDGSAGYNRGAAELMDNLRGGLEILLKRRRFSEAGYADPDG